MKLLSGLWRFLESTAGWVLAIAVCGAVLLPAHYFAGGGEYSPLIALVLTYVVGGLFSVVAIVIHELGHAVAAWSMG